MSEPFLSEIRIVSFSYAPMNWAFCNGQLLPIAQNPALYALIGTIYGGDGNTNFALPDLRGRVPVHCGAGPGLSEYAIGSRGGSERVTLEASQIPTHTHTAVATTNPATTNVPTGNILADSGPAIYASPNAPVGMINGPSGIGGYPHENRMPYLSLNYCIALGGLFPPRN